DFFSELLAQYARLDLLDLTFGQFAQLERTVGDPDQPVHLETQMRHHIAHFAIFSFADCKHQPDIGPLVAFERSIDRTIFNAIDFDAVFKFVQLRLRDLTVSADAIAPKPTGIRQFEHA